MSPAGASAQTATNSQVDSQADLQPATKPNSKPNSEAKAQAAAPDYAREIKPLLAKRCGSCHGASKQEAGLRLDAAKLARQGGDSGPAIVPGQAAASRLIKAVRGIDDVARMPPEDQAALTAAEIALLERWIDAGAAAPENETIETVAVDHWSFRRPVRPVVPDVHRLGVPAGHVSASVGPAGNAATGATPASGGPAIARTPIDAFIGERLAREKFAMAPDADRAVLARRLNLDLLGLPPEVETVVELEADTAPDAFERHVDRLLAHPAFGERWGRYWLDQARYADSNGYTRDFGREIWPFREWVIRAINRDLPFDQFTIEQLAGDMLPQATTEQVVATGFHRNTLVNEEGGTDQEQFRIEAVADRVATTGQVWLGLTLGCARCHNHKYDPISQREFYQLFAILNNCEEPQVEAPSQLNLERGDIERRASIRARIDELEKQFETRRAELEASQASWEKTVTVQQRAQLPGPIQVAYDMALAKRDAANKKLLEDYYRQTPHARAAFPVLDEIAQLRDSEPKIPRTMVLKELAKPRETHVHKRGDFLNLGVKVEPATPTALHPLGTSRPTRLDFARWLADPANPLTPRVVVNRYWQYLFGRGLVETEDDFGLQGSRPTHPELLDWLACEFTAPGDFSTKRFLRLIVTSSVYRQSSRRRPELEDRDPRNEWLGRQNRLRVDAEIVRDLSLAASGLLTRELGGPSVMPPQPEGVYAFTQDPKPWKAETGGNRFRRGLYTFFWRSLPYPMLTTFDAPNANVSCTRRLRSNTPLQALTMANDIVFVECAEALARRAAGDADQLFRIALARRPSTDERARLLKLVEQQREAFAREPALARQMVRGEPPAGVDHAELAAWTAVARVLMNLDEFITRE
jgi:hypothetical protein